MSTAVILERCHHLDHSLIQYVCLEKAAPEKINFQNHRICGIVPCKQPLLPWSSNHRTHPQVQPINPGVVVQRLYGRHIATILLGPYSEAQEFALYQSSLESTSCLQMQYVGQCHGHGAGGILVLNTMGPSMTTPTSFLLSGN